MRILARADKGAPYFMAIILPAKIFMIFLCRAAEIPMDLIWINSLLFDGRLFHCRRAGLAMLDAIFVVLGIVIFAATCGYAVVCDRM